jgi:hypothetical protein
MKYRSLNKKLQTTLWSILRNYFLESKNLVAKKIFTV